MVQLDLRLEQLPLDVELLLALGIELASATLQIFLNHLAVHRQFDPLPIVGLGFDPQAGNLGRQFQYALL